MGNRYVYGLCSVIKLRKGWFSLRTRFDQIKNPAPIFLNCMLVIAMICQTTFNAFKLVYVPENKLKLNFFASEKLQEIGVGFNL